MCHNGHPFEPGIDVDNPARPDPSWCNVCGERRPCPFCDYGTGRAVPAGGLLFDGASAIAFRPLNPFAPGHTLIVPRLHYESFVDADAATTTAVMAAARILARRPGPDGINLVTSAGAAATQTVMHWHVHLIPRQAGDALAQWPWTRPTEETTS